MTPYTQNPKFHCQHARIINGNVSPTGRLILSNLRLYNYYTEELCHHCIAALHNIMAGRHLHT